jgi:hypothetical protein
MCEAIIWYYPRQNLLSCGSAYFELEKIYDQFGIEELSWDFGDAFNPTVTAPAQHAGKTFNDMLNEYEWTAENKAELEHRLRYTKHASQCHGPLDGWEERYTLRNAINSRMAQKHAGLVKTEEDFEEIGYPDIEEYAPPKTCSNEKYFGQIVAHAHNQGHHHH